MDFDSSWAAYLNWKVPEFWVWLSLGLYNTHESAGLLTAIIYILIYEIFFLTFQIN